MDSEAFNELRIDLANVFSSLTAKLNSKLTSFPSYISPEGENIKSPKYILIEAKDIKDDIDYLKWAITLLATYGEVGQGIKPIWDDIKSSGGITKFNV